MCFRPGNVTAPLVCPECGNRVPVVAGYIPDACPACGYTIPEEDEAQAIAGVAPMSAPTAPKAPAAPKVPAAPKAPAAPREAGV